jgi:antitoxin (DNA-binding transcriptional repressor) of toxin-antitoxin stability system
LPVEADLLDVDATCSYNRLMRAIGIRVLKNKLSEYVRMAESGETVLVTDRDRVVAELRPPEAGRSFDVADALLADAVRRGVIRPPSAAGAGAPPRRPTASLAQVLAGLAADRGDR